MVDKIKCKSADCTAMILPSTAESTGGVCMRCKRKADEADYEAYVRKNRRTVDPFVGITDPVEITKVRHEPRTYDPLITYLPHATPPADLYGALTEPQLSQLIKYVRDHLASSKRQAALGIAKELAAFTTADLAPMQHAFLANDEYHPGFLFRDASPDMARRLIDRLTSAIGDEHDKVKLGHTLEALAWASTDDVVSLFAQWREDPPDWCSRLYIPPERYAHCAGWELDQSAKVRKLILGTCYPLLKTDGSADIGPAATCLELGASCQWCNGPLTRLFVFDLTNERLDFIAFRGRKLTIATCQDCSTFSDHLYMNVGPDGEASWHAGNQRPRDLPKDSGTGKGLPANQVRLSAKPRLLHHAVDWSLPTTCSQVGGMPSWIDDPMHDQCPECSKGFVFVAQLAVEDVEAWGEGIYYALMCPDCSITVVRYQQT